MVQRLLTTCFSCSDFVNPTPSTTYSSPEEDITPYVVLVAMDPSQTLVKWHGESVKMEYSEDTDIDVSCNNVSRVVS